MNIKERALASLVCFILCPIFGAIAIEFTKWGGDYSTFLTSVGSLFTLLFSIFFSALAVFTLIGIFGAWAPTSTSDCDD